MLLYGDDLSTGDLESAKGAAATLERWSILTLDDGGKYRVHDEHADFIQGRFAANQDIRDTALPRWRRYISSVRALRTFSAKWLVEIWEVMARVEGEGVPSRPYDEALDAMDPSSADHLAALRSSVAFSYERKDWLDAFDKSSQHVKIREKSVGVDPLEVALGLNSHGACAFMAGKTEESEESHRRALAIREKEQGGDHPDVAATLRDLGNAAYQAGRTEEAEKCLRRALTIEEAKLGVDHPDVASTLTVLGLSASREGRMGEAEEFHRRALKIREDKLGADHPDVGRSLCGLGYCAAKAERMEEAEMLYRRALPILEKLGVGWPEVEQTRTALVLLEISKMFRVS